MKTYNQILMDKLTINNNTYIISATGWKVVYFNKDDSIMRQQVNVYSSENTNVPEVIYIVYDCIKDRVSSFHRQFWTSDLLQRHLKFNSQFATYCRKHDVPPPNYRGMIMPTDPLLVQPVSKKSIMKYFGMPEKKTSITFTSSGMTIGNCSDDRESNVVFTTVY